LKKTTAFHYEQELKFIQHPTLFCIESVGAEVFVQIRINTGMRFNALESASGHIKPPLLICFINRQVIKMIIFAQCHRIKILVKRLNVNFIRIYVIICKQVFVQVLIFVYFVTLIFNTGNEETNIRF